MNRNMDMINDLLNMFRHVVVFQNEVASALMPEKEHGNFSNQEELSQSIKKRSDTIKQGRIL